MSEGKFMYLLGLIWGTSVRIIEDNAVHVLADVRGGYYQNKSFG